MDKIKKEAKLLGKFSLVGVILCWNTIKIDGIVEALRPQGELVDDDVWHIFY